MNVTPSTRAIILIAAVRYALNARQPILSAGMCDAVRAVLFELRDADRETLVGDVAAWLERIAGDDSLDVRPWRKLHAWMVEGA